MPLKRLKLLNTRECLWIYILRILKEGSSHAYTLRKEIEKRFKFKPGTMTAYKVLYLLTASGFVTKKDEGRKKIYHITEKGEKALKEAADFYKNLVKRLS
ncbi:MAG: PadR family transcriptional regulator [Nanoarchaeota archaeon]|nr:PadR family transcriptional regulator [Nanoarchaeota archaeon]MBU1135139.1 PadR family transcriptional regulator [Nanoarchaeota archaeon]MBU2520185.1 PadR family transcriptional regulator [Nanoarchaeota archaeon]